MPCLAWVPVVLRPSLALTLKLCKDIPVLAHWVAMATLLWVLEAFLALCVCCVVLCMCSVCLFTRIN